MIFHTLFCVLYFIFELKANVNNINSIWILNYYIYYYVFLYIIIQIFIWLDDTHKKDNEHQEITDKKKKKLLYSFFVKHSTYFMYFIVLLLVIFLDVEFYIFINMLAGQIFSLIIIVFTIGFLVLQNWINNKFILNNILQKVCIMFLFISALISFLGE